MIGRILVIFVLVAAILGGSGYFINELYFKAKKLDREEKVAQANAEPALPPDPSLAAFEKIKPLLEQNSPEARDALTTFLNDYPESSTGATVRAALGRINVTQVLSPTSSSEKTTYVVQSGDSLVKIAAKFKTGAELIYRANNLETINLKIGQELMIPKLDTSIVVNRGNGTLTVFNGGVFFKEYPTLSLKPSPTAASGTVETKVNERLAMKGNTRVAFGTKDFDGSERWITLSMPGVVIRSMPVAGSDGVVPAPPPGIVVSPEDAAEISVLSTRGTPVTIK